MRLRSRTILETLCLMLLLAFVFSGCSEQSESEIIPHDVYHLRGLEEYAFHSISEQVRQSGTTNQQSLRNVFQELSGSDDVLVVYTDGLEEYVESGMSELELVSANGHWSVGGKPVAIVWENPPERSAFDVHPHILEELEQEALLVFFVDGLGYQKLVAYSADNPSTYWNRVDFEPMRAAYPPKTMVNYPVFGTGKLKHVNQKDFRIFDQVAAQELKGLIIEGDIQLFQTSLDVVLTSGRSDDGGIDNAIYEQAVNYIDQDYDFMFIHFHDIDDFGHLYGPDHELTEIKIEETGKYIIDLAERWKGNTLIISDHGMHEYFDLDNEKIYGTHDSGRLEDILAIFGRVNTNTSIE